MPDGRRTARIKRVTRETAIELALGLDGPARVPRIRGPIPFLNHMLTLFAAHAGFSLDLKTSGDVDVDDHHLVEDAGICLGQAIGRALADKAGIRRYGEATVPMDESLVHVALDLSGRSWLAYGMRPSARSIKRFEVALVKEFFLGFARNVPCTVHVRQLTRKGNAHHEIEALFKAFGTALGAAVARRPGRRGIPSTKGSL